MSFGPVEYINIFYCFRQLDVFAQLLMHRPSWKSQCSSPLRQGAFLWNMSLWGSTKEALHTREDDIRMEKIQSPCALRQVRVTAFVIWKYEWCNKQQLFTSLCLFCLRSLGFRGVTRAAIHRGEDADFMDFAHIYSRFPLRPQYAAPLQRKTRPSYWSEKSACRAQNEHAQLRSHWCICNRENNPSSLKQ